MSLCGRINTHNNRVNAQKTTAVSCELLQQTKTPAANTLKRIPLDRKSKALISKQLVPVCPIDSGL